MLSHLNVYLVLKSLRKTFLGLKADKLPMKFSKELTCTLKNGECIHSDKFSKVNALRTEDEKPLPLFSAGKLSLLFLMSICPYTWLTRDRTEI